MPTTKSAKGKPAKQASKQAKTPAGKAQKQAQTLMPAGPNIEFKPKGKGKR